MHGLDQHNLEPPPIAQASFVLRPSSIEGVGVHSVHDIETNQKLDLWGDEPEHSSPLDEVKDDAVVMRFGVVLEGRVWHSPCFSRMAIGWYLNHSDFPNIESRADDQMYSLRPIKAGEELTVDYRTLESTTQ